MYFVLNTKFERWLLNDNISMTRRDTPAPWQDITPAPFTPLPGTTRDTYLSFKIPQIVISQFVTRRTLQTGGKPALFTVRLHPV